MNRRAIIFAVLAAVIAASPVSAITPGSDLLIAGAARSGPWVADLLINNPGTSNVTVEVFWLERSQANNNPVSQTYAVGPDATLVLTDVMKEEFGMDTATGAFRIVATGGVVTANLIAYAVVDDADGYRTFGSGFEAIPASSATSTGQTTNIMGMVANSAFRTNLFALAGANGATVKFDLLDTDGDVVDTSTVTLRKYEPWLRNVTKLWDVASFDDGTAQVRVTAGSAVVLGSKIDSNKKSTDPTTLEPAFGAGAASVDGTYQFAIYDSALFATGGFLEIFDGDVETIWGTYNNYDKDENSDGVEDCTVVFQWGDFFEPTAVEDFESGVQFTDSYAGSGDMTWTLTFTVSDNMGFSGTISAVGSGFSGDNDGCNGTFPPMVFEGGKTN